MAGDDNVVYLDTDRTSAKGAALLERLETLAGSHLSEALRAALDAVDDALFDRAERSASNADQERYFIAMRQARLHRRAIEKRFADEIASRFVALTSASRSGGRSDTAVSGNDLELMDEADVEQDVAVDTLASRLSSRHAFVLSQLSTRLDALVGERTIDDDTNPVGPRALAESFRGALDVLDIEIQPRIILYKLLEKALLARYGKLCEALNASLVEAGVLPGLRHSVRTSDAGEPSRSGGEGDHGRDVSSAESEHAETDGEQVLRTLRELIARAKQGGGVYGAPANPPAETVEGTGAELTDLVAVLSGFQTVGARSETAVAVDASRLKALVSRGLEKRGTAAGIGRAADDTIDIVSMLFEVILDDDRLHGSIKALIARLQIPVLKVALVDRDFFASRQHPARQLINELARAAVGWNEPEDPAADPLYREMSGVVEYVIDEFVDDVSVFRDALRDFRHYLEKEQARAQVIEDRTRQAAEGKARVEDAREQVHGEIQRRLRGREAPAVVRTLLEEAWFRVLFITAVKEGTEGPLWDRQLAVMDQLVWSVTPKTSAEARRRMLNEMPDLLRELREGLNGIMYNPFEMTRLFGELEAEHLRILAEPARPTPEPQESPRRTDASDAPDSGAAASAEGRPADDVGERAAEGLIAPPPPDDEPAVESGEHRLSPGGAEDDPSTAPSSTLDPATPPEASDAGIEDDHGGDELAQRLRALDLGTWFELTDSEGHENRAKLSARLNRGRRFVFVNRAGFKVADRSLDDLLTAVREGRASILDDNTLFDRALESVIGSLRDLRAGQEL